jgi:hypothetical protein
MKYIDASLVPGEIVVYRTRLHWIVMLRHILLGSLLLAGSGALLSYLLHRPRSGTTGEHLIEGGAAALLKRDGDGGHESPCRCQAGPGEP